MRLTRRGIGPIARRITGPPAGLERVGAVQSIRVGMSRSLLDLAGPPIDLASLETALRRVEDGPTEPAPTRASGRPVGHVRTNRAVDPPVPPTTATAGGPPLSIPSLAGGPDGERTLPRSSGAAGPRLPASPPAGLSSAGAWAGPSPSLPGVEPLESAGPREVVSGAGGGANGTPVGKRSWEDSSSGGWRPLGDGVPAPSSSPPHLRQYSGRGAGLPSAGEPLRVSGEAPEPGDPAGALGDLVGRWSRPASGVALPEAQRGSVPAERPRVVREPDHVLPPPTMVATTTARSDRPGRSEIAPRSGRDRGSSADRHGDVFDVPLDLLEFAIDEIVAREAERYGLEGLG